jgi:hypothetical protein
MGMLEEVGDVFDGMLSSRRACPARELVGANAPGKPGG